MVKTLQAICSGFVLLFLLNLYQEHGKLEAIFENFADKLFEAGADRILRPHTAPPDIPASTSLQQMQPKPEPTSTTITSSSSSSSGRILSSNRKGVMGKIAASSDPYVIYNDYDAATGSDLDYVLSQRSEALDCRERCLALQSCTGFAKMGPSCYLKDAANLAANKVPKMGVDLYVLVSTTTKKSSSSSSSSLPSKTIKMGVPLPPPVLPSDESKWSVSLRVSLSFALMNEDHHEEHARHLIGNKNSASSIEEDHPKPNNVYRVEGKGSARKTVYVRERGSFGYEELQLTGNAVSMEGLLRGILENIPGKPTENRHRMDDPPKKPIRVYTIYTVGYKVIVLTDDDVYGLKQDSKLEFVYV
mmetsp:Transcript_11614/g.21291  ORF Transcript_11614/g.21291 Transcript_11614/m.21291 type:complete len:360 (+) Transcript_11614:128-1207(+)